MGTNKGTRGEHIEVLIVDDHPPIREALSIRIESAMGMNCVGTCGTAREALKALEERLPDVLVVDVSLRDAYGLDFVEQVRSRYADVQIVVFSMHDEDVYAERAVRRGAMSYLMKTESTEKVVEAIRSANAGRVYLSERMATNILNQLPENGSPTPGFPIDSLTDRELAVFQMLGRGYSISDITDRLSLCRKTVETYRRRAKEKLGLDSTGELLQYAIEWIHGQDDEEPSTEVME